MSIVQGDIVSINLNPTKGREQNGTRPAVVISGDAFHFSHMYIVCPLTSTIHGFSGDVILTPDAHNGLTAESEVLVGHIRSVSKDRIGVKIGSVSRHQLEEIWDGVDLILNR